VPHAQFQYQVAQWLTDEQIDEMERMREEPVAYRILGQAPDGSSLVRLSANGAAPQQITQTVNIQVAPPQQDINPKLIEAKVEDITPQVPLDDTPPPKPAMKPIEDAPPDMNALLAAMRPPAR